MKLYIVGGGPAGLAAAIALRQAGFHPIVSDCSIPPIDKACGEGLMPDSIEALHKLGVAIPEDAGYRFDGISFFDEQSAVSAPFPKGNGVGLRRTVLHNLLRERAEELGIPLSWGVSKIPFQGSGASFLVAADGHNSYFRRTSAWAAVAVVDYRYGFRRHFRIAPWSRNVEIYWGHRFQIYVTPVAPDEVCVALISRQKAFRLAEALEQIPRLGRLLGNALPITSELGSISASRRLRRVVGRDPLTGNPVALIGDASGSVDAITGQGMCLSFRQALALADALRSGDLRAYGRSHARIRRVPAMMSQLMLTLDHHPALQRRALSALAKCPDAFASLVSMHVGESPFVNLCSLPIVNLGIAFLEY